MKLASIVSAVRGKRGFSLIELLVVILIIVALIAILVPAVSQARQQAYKTATETLMTGLNAAIRKYSQDFNGALPGVYPQYYTNAGGTPIAANPGAQTVGVNTSPLYKISGTQNLLLAVAYAFSGTAAGGTYVAVPGSSNTITSVSLNTSTPTVDYMLANGPKDYTTTTTPTENKQYSPYYSPQLNDLKTCQNSFKLTSIGTAWTVPYGSTGPNAFPVVVDRYSDPLPILYFRRDAAAGTWVADNRGTALATGMASYYRQENSEYLDGWVYSINGVGYNQGAKSSYSSTFLAAANTNLENAIKTAIGGSNFAYTSRGDYVLMSAGPDRYYGIMTGSLTSDDQVHVSSK